MDFKAVHASEALIKDHCEHEGNLCPPHSESSQTLSHQLQLLLDNDFSSIL